MSLHLPRRPKDSIEKEYVVVDTLPGDTHGRSVVSMRKGQGSASKYVKNYARK